MALNPFFPLRKKAARWLQDVAAITTFTDDSLSAYLMGLPSGGAVDRSTLSNYRAGRRGAPLELLFAVLHHADQEERRRILELLARPFGLRVVPIEGDRTADLMRSALAASRTSAQLTEAAHLALLDGRIDEQEREQLSALASTLETNLRAVQAITERRAS